MIGDVRIQRDSQALANSVAEWLTRSALAADSERFRIALSGGSTPATLYATLACVEYRDRFPWKRVSWYWGDERFVPLDDPASNFHMADRAMLSRVPVPAENIHPIVVGGSPELSARRYESTLQDVYGASSLDPERPLFDLVLLGLGSDGHTASLLPGSSALEERRRWVVAVPRGRPEPRITLTYPVLESSRSVAFLVSGAEKAQIFAAIGAGNSDVPAARLRPRGELIWFADRAAAGVGSRDRQ